MNAAEHIGFRIHNAEEIDWLPLNLIQISYWKGKNLPLSSVRELIDACRTRGKRYLLHPINFFLSDTRPRIRSRYMETLRILAEWSDLGLILHDETLPDGRRLEGEFEKLYEEGLRELGEICPVYIENANKSQDILWFWKEFAPAALLDIGHLEAAGLDSLRFVKELPGHILEKIDYVHIHRREGTEDHLSLDRPCRELEALGEILRMKPDVKTLIEIDGKKELEESLARICEMTGFGSGG